MNTKDRPTHLTLFNHGAPVVACGKSEPGDRHTRQMENVTCKPCKEIQ